MRAPFLGSEGTNRLTFAGKLILVLMTGLSAYLGVMPVTMVLNRPLWAYAFWVLVIIFSLVKIWNVESLATRKPDSRDYIAAFISSLYPALATGIAWLLFYGFLYIVDFGIHWILRLIGLELPWTSSTAAFYGSLVFAAVLAAALPEILVPTLLNYLHPNAAGVTPAFRQLPEESQRRRLNISMTVIFFAVTLGLLTAVIPGPGFRALYSVMLFFSLVVSASLWKTGLQGELAKFDAARGLTRLFEALDFRVRRRYATGDPEVDPLLVELDLIAWRGGIGFAVKLKVPRLSTPWQETKDAPPVTWETGQVVFAAASAARRSLPPEVECVVPMLVLVNREPNAALRAFAEGENLIVLKMTMQQLERVERSSLDRKVIGPMAVECGLAEIIESVVAGRRHDSRWKRTPDQLEEAMERNQSEENTPSKTTAMAAGTPAPRPQTTSGAED